MDFFPSTLLITVNEELKYFFILLRVHFTL